MADDPRQPRDLSPDEVATRVAAILASAERDALEIVAAARREAPDLFASVIAPEQPAAVSQATNGDRRSAEPSLHAVVEALEELAARIDHFETTIKARIDVLWRAISRPRVGVGEESRDASARAAGPPAHGAEETDREVRARAEHVHAVELALRGFSREQIAAQLRFALPSEEIERLLDEVLERPEPD
jgi:hypothetical protein